MVARGQEAQWGSEPWSRRPTAIARVRAMATGGGLWIAQAGDEAVGALVVGDAPAHVAPAGEPELYVELLLTSRRHAGRGLGALLLAQARALATDRGVGLLRVDCWAAAPTLVAWYERQGFVRSGTFDVGGWPGQVFEQRLG